MFSSTKIILCAFLLLYPYGSLIEAQEGRRYVCLLSDPPNQCSEYCVSALQPVIDHLSKEQQDWGACEVKVNGTVAKLDKIEDQLTATQIKIEAQQAFLVNNISKAIAQDDLVQKLKDIEGNQTVLGNQLKDGQKRTESQLTAIQKSLSDIERKLVLQRYQQIGSRYFYIEHNLQVNWRTAEQMCIEMGGHLAAFQNAQEYNAIVSQLNKANYWLGVNDLAKQGEFISLASGKRATYFKWRKNEPKYNNPTQHCAYVYGHENIMIVLSCTTDVMHFICQSDSDV
ncbi:accessory gland protein Acp29AB [Drosophila sechellia]|uniref:GM16433 n=1 Tax=Drosophila sechellia TaxID=7238 RepID=B4HY60_DROSE|nr:accessory gland protein Acp29AB [Drosophila sechellia]EDW51990.1 GM16433 [Drosophila sechellia]